MRANTIWGFISLAVGCLLPFFHPGPFLMWGSAIFFLFAALCFFFWPQKPDGHAQAISAQTEEMRLARELARHNADPAIRAFNEARATDVQSGVDIQEKPLGFVAYWIATNSAWGRWQAAQHQNAGDAPQLLKMAADYILFEYLETGRLATRGHRNGSNDYEFISPDWWGRFHFRLDTDNVLIYKASIHSRHNVDAAAHPSYSGICCDWNKVLVLFPKKDERTDALTAGIIAKGNS